VPFPSELHNEKCKKLASTYCWNLRQSDTKSIIESITAPLYIHFIELIQLMFYYYNIILNNIWLIMINQAIKSINPWTKYCTWNVIVEMQILWTCNEKPSEKHAHTRLKISLINMLSSITWWEKNWICSQYSQPVSDERYTNTIHTSF